MTATDIEQYEQTIDAVDRRFRRAFQGLLTVLGAIALGVSALFSFVAAPTGGTLRSLVLGIAVLSLAAYERKTHRMDVAGIGVTVAAAIIALWSVGERGLFTSTLPLLVLMAPMVTYTSGVRVGKIFVWIAQGILVLAAAASPHNEPSYELSVFIVTASSILATGNITLAFRTRTEAQAKHQSAMNAELRNKELAANAANTAKTTFLATMSHEIRTPLNAVIGLAEMLGERPLDPADKALALQIRRSGALLLDLLNGVLDLSHIESGTLSVHPVPVAIRELCEGVIEALSRNAESKGIELRFEFGETAPLWVETDPTRVRQVLVNLIGNALKFTQKGHVTLKVTAMETEPGVSCVTFSVIDTGIGIAHEARERIFDPFAQADEGRDRAFGGSGLGLSIASRIATRLGGRLQLVNTAIGVGSEFAMVVDLPHASAPATHDDACQTCVKGIRVLVAEDDRINQMVVEAQLRALGCEVHLVSNGEEAVEAAFGGYDFVLMDQQMPRVDGVEATRRLRASGFHLPIVALTANAFEDDRQVCLEAGMNDFLTKPVSRADLVRILRQYVQPDCRAQGCEPSATVPANTET